MKGGIGLCDKKNRFNLAPIQIQKIATYDLVPRGVICRLCNKDRDQGQQGIGVRYRSCSDIQYNSVYTDLGYVNSRQFFYTSRRDLLYKSAN